MKPTILPPESRHHETAIHPIAANDPRWQNLRHQIETLAWESIDHLTHRIVSNRKRECAMRVSDLQPISELTGVPVLSEHDDRAQPLLKPDCSCQIAEATDTVRLFELMHRRQYEPIAIIRFGREQDSEARVYFAHREVEAECNLATSVTTFNRGKRSMSPRFLIAYRDPTVREECRRCLAARGYEVEVAADALQCIEQLRATASTVLVLDPELLWGGGDGVLEWLSDEAPVTPLTVFLVDGHSCGHISDELRSHVARILERPHGLRELVLFVNLLEDEARRRPTRRSSLVSGLEESLR